MPPALPGDKQDRNQINVSAGPAQCFNCIHIYFEDKGNIRKGSMWCDNSLKLHKQQMEYNNNNDNKESNLIINTNMW